MPRRDQAGGNISRCSFDYSHGGQMAGLVRSLLLRLILCRAAAMIYRGGQAERKQSIIAADVGWL